jgi:hypothetical protein
MAVNDLPPQRTTARVYFLNKIKMEYSFEIFHLIYIFMKFVLLGGGAQLCC